MSNVEIQSVLSQIRSLRTQSPSVAADRPAASEPLSTVGRAPAPTFTDAAKAVLDSVNEAQQSSNDLKTRFQMGDPGADLAQVMLASGRAQVSFTALTEVRNRLVSAYQDVMNMPV
ncbi:MAG: flagellar hook-basal body complex protein FliE [Abyssibacter sp.]|uniref:flagellar hook-basal body complex protein FliE n=1 Tax=Abyssibacter sp. TaxID=2320200 RepID=UPI002E9C995C|nr:flagellar hook-basal body complex protein FliE [Pseudomonadota bacterium]